MKFEYEKNLYKSYNVIWYAHVIKSHDYLSIVSAFCMIVCMRAYAIVLLHPDHFEVFRGKESFYFLSFV